MAKVTAHLSYVCTDGKAGGAAARVKGKLRVEDDRFAGTLRRRADFGDSRRPRDDQVPNPRKVPIEKAKGTVDAEIRFRATEMRGGPFIRCYTGEVDWKASRGADLKPIESLRRIGS